MTIKELAIKHGINALIFGLPARPVGVSWDDFHTKDYVQEIKTFVIDETKPNRIASEGYKICLKCLTPGYCDDEYYQTDLEGFMRDHPNAYWVAVKENFGID